jgi:hypothetical protein
VIDALRKFFSRRRGAYQDVFRGPQAEIVLADLALKCGAYRTTILPDPRASEHLAARREVWLHIQEQLKLSDDELWSLRSRGMPDASE